MNESIDVNFIAFVNRQESWMLSHVALISMETKKEKRKVEQVFKAFIDSSVSSAVHIVIKQHMGHRKFHINNISYCCCLLLVILSISISVLYFILRLCPKVLYPHSNSQLID